MESFVELAQRLLDLEREWQWEESGRMLRECSSSFLQREGKALLNLEVGEMHSGLGTKCMIQLERAIGGELPATKIQVGDLVCLREQEKDKKKTEIKGVVTKVIPSKSITVAVEAEEIKENSINLTMGKLQLFLMPNEISFERNSKALRALKPNFLSPYLFEGQSNANKSRSPNEFIPFNKQLDTSQLEAVNHALETTPLALIHGPPGTGKTMTLVEIILQLCKANSNIRILVCGPSNVSVDNVLERLSPFAQGSSLNLVRIGHPARMLEAVNRHSLDSLCMKSEQSQIIRELRSEIDTLVRKLFFSNQKVPDRRANLDLLSTLRKDLRARERKLTNQIIDSTAQRKTIIFSTLIGAGGRALQCEQFDFVIIDESTQALESECWIAMLKAKRGVILAGDHKQLPPTVTCPQAIEGGLERTIFDRVEKINPHLIKMLQIQYRMNEVIMKLFSREFYSDALKCASCVREITLSDLNQSLASDEEWCDSLIFIDTQYSDNPRESTIETSNADSNSSKQNAKEAEIVFERVSYALESLGINPIDIAVISPYNAQVSLISSMFQKEGLSGVEVGTVDGFQGREKEIVILSLVRSNAEREIGFLSDYRRLNVGVSRAKRQLIVIGDAQTLSSSPVLKRMISYIEECGLVHIAE